MGAQQSASCGTWFVSNRPLTEVEMEAHYRRTDEILKRQRDLLRQVIEHIEDQVRDLDAQQLDAMRAYKAEQRRSLAEDLLKPRIMYMLKHRHTLATRIETKRQLLLNVERQIDSCHDARMNANVTLALKQSIENLRLVQNQVRMEDVQEMMQESEEQQQTVADIQSALGVSMNIEYGSAAAAIFDIDESELEREFDALVAKEAQEQASRDAAGIVETVLEPTSTTPSPGSRVKVFQ